MVTLDFVRSMARYNRWQNDSLYHAAQTLSEAARQQERGAFFGSIQGTLSHLLWGDSVWLSRFAGWPKPEGGIKDSPQFRRDWSTLVNERRSLDQAIVDWADVLEPDWLVGDLTWYSGALGRKLSRPRTLLLVHFFNHQTHHRGQVHAMLTAAGAKPDDTDLMVMPNL